MERGWGIIRGWKFPKDLFLLVGLEFISVVSDTNAMTGMTHEWSYSTLGRCFLKLWGVGHKWGS